MIETMRIIHHSRVHGGGSMLYPILETLRKALPSFGKQGFVVIKLVLGEGVVLSLAYTYYHRLYSMDVLVAAIEASDLFTGEENVTSIFWGFMY